MWCFPIVLKLHLKQSGQDNGCWLTALFPVPHGNWELRVSMASFISLLILNKATTQPTRDTGLSNHRWLHLELMNFTTGSWLVLYALREKEKKNVSCTTTPQGLLLTIVFNKDILAKHYRMRHISVQWDGGAPYHVESPRVKCLHNVIHTRHSTAGILITICFVLTYDFKSMLWRLVSDKKLFVVGTCLKSLFWWNGLGLVIRTFKIQLLKPEVADHHVTDTIVTAWWPSPDGPNTRRLTSNSRVFDLSKATLCWSK